MTEIKDKMEATEKVEPVVKKPEKKETPKIEPKESAKKAFELSSLLNAEQIKTFQPLEYLALVKVKKMHGDKTQIVTTYMKQERFK